MILLSESDSDHLRGLLDKIGDELLVTSEDSVSVYEEEPVDIRTFIISPDYLNAGKHTYAVVIEDLDKIFNGGYTEAVLLEGIGSGKSHAAAIAIVYMVYRTLCLKDPQSYYPGLSPDSKIAFMNMSTSATQAKKIVFGRVSSMVQNCAWFQKKGYLPNPKKTSELEFPKGIYVIPGSSSETAPLGFDILGAVLDEAAFMVDTKTSNKRSAEGGDHNVAEEIYNTLQRRIESRFLDKGLILIISSPRYKGDFISTKYDEAKINSQIYAVRRATFDCKSKDFYSGIRFIVDTKNKLILVDTAGKVIKTDDKKRFYTNEEHLLTIPIEYLKSAQRNLIKFMRDICAIASRAITPYISNYSYWEKIAKESTLKHPFENGKFADWFKGNGEAAAVHVDLGTGKSGNDACGIAMAIINPQDKSKYQVPFMESLRAPEGQEIEFGYVRDIIIALRNLGFDIKYVTYDGWQSIDSRQQLEKKGFITEYLSVDKDLEPYDTLKEVTNEGKVDYYHHPVFLEEIEGLELIEGKKVDHPPKGSKDLTDSVAGAIYKLVSSPPEDVEMWFG
jgi:hypothetical protein